MQIFKRGVYSGKITYIYICLKGGILREGGADSGRITYRCLKQVYVLGGRGRFWEGRLCMFKGGVYYGREE